MLSIYLYSNNSSSGGFLDISPDTTLDIESLSEMFDEDLSIGEFSLPVDIPWTENNRRLMGFAERIQNMAQKSVFWRVDVYDDGVPEIVGGKLTILEKVGNWSYTKGKFSASIAGTKGLFGSRIKGRKLRDLELGGVIAWASGDSRDFAKAVMTGGYPQYNHIAFAPVAIENFIATDRTDYTTEFLAFDTANYVVSTNNTWTFGRASENNPLVRVGSGMVGYCDYRTIPFFNFKFVLRKLFEENGYNVQGALFDDNEWDALFLFNNCGIEIYDVFANVDYNKSIIPRRHVPDMLQSDFLKKACSFFNLRLDFIGVNTARLTYREDVLQNRRIASLNDVIGTGFDSTPQDTDSSSDSGYTLKYSWDEKDDFHTERVKDISDKTLIATVSTFLDLGTINIGRPLTTDDVAMVQSENLYYSVADATTSPVTWQVHSENLNDYVSGEGSKSVETGMSTLCRYVVADSNSGLLVKKPYVGTRQAGSYTNNKGVQVESGFDLRVFFIRTLSQHGQMSIPVSYNHNRDDDNAIVEKHSLAWQGTEGMAAGFHLNWRKVNENMEIVKSTIEADTKVLSVLANNDAFEINNVQFLPYKKERSIPAKKDCDIYLVPL